MPHVSTGRILSTNQAKWGTSDKEWARSGEIEFSYPDQRDSMTILMRVIAVFFSLFFATWAEAQIMLPGSGDGTSPPTVELISRPEAVRELVSRMSDADVRAVLLERLDAVAAKAALQNGEDDSLWDFANRTGT